MHQRVRVVPNPKDGDRVHAVIIVCEGPAVQSVEEMGRLQQIFHRLTSKGKIPTFLITDKYFLLTIQN